MTEVTLLMDSAVVLFYTKIAELAGLPVEKVLSDTLYKLAGELSLEALGKTHLKGSPCQGSWQKSLIFD